MTGVSRSSSRCASPRLHPPITQAGWCPITTAALGTPKRVSPLRQSDPGSTQEWEQDEVESTTDSFSTSSEEGATPLPSHQQLRQRLRRVADRELLPVAL